jgi:hypothetical protein
MCTRPSPSASASAGTIIARHRSNANSFFMGYFLLLNLTMFGGYTFNHSFDNKLSLYNMNVNSISTQSPKYLQVNFLTTAT